jgi:hypothetical protein
MFVSVRLAFTPVMVRRSCSSFKWIPCSNARGSVRRASGFVQVGFWEVKIHGSPNLEILELDPSQAGRVPGSTVLTIVLAHEAVRLAAAPHY